MAKCLLEGSIENRIAGGIDEIGEKDSVFFREGMDFRGAPVESACNKATKSSAAGARNFHSRTKGFPTCADAAEEGQCRLLMDVLDAAGVEATAD